MIEDVDDVRRVRRAMLAVCLGRVADREFQNICLRLRLEPDVAVLAPLDAIIDAQQGEHHDAEPTADRRRQRQAATPH
jgi:hypothetical protein